jgi:hypothetical protein
MMAERLRIRRKAVETLQNSIGWRGGCWFDSRGAHWFVWEAEVVASEPCAIVREPPITGEMTALRPGEILFNSSHEAWQCVVERIEKHIELLTSQADACRAKATNMEAL